MLTKEEKLKVYKEALKDAKVDYELSKEMYYEELNLLGTTSSKSNLIGICGLIGRKHTICLEDLPELLACKPKDKKLKEHWWPINFNIVETRLKRIEVLEQIIKNLEQNEES